MMAAMGATAMRVALGVGLVLLAHVGGASAGLCDGVPQCQPQVMGAVSYSAWHTSGWAYYCSGDHPYYWNTDQILGLFGHNYTFDNNCFSVSENPFAESGDPSKFDATITNWCFKGEDITVTIGCSAAPQDAAPSCSNKTSSVIKDPGCPIQSGSSKNWCSGTNPPVCFQTWTENCSSGQVYCTDDLTVVWCVTCSQ
jgi:hypothetical protein